MLIKFLYDLNKMYVYFMSMKSRHLILIHRLGSNEGSYNVHV